MPRTDAKAHAELPVPMPKAESDAARAPARKAWRMMKAVSGPGVTMRMAATVIQAANRVSNTGVMCHPMLHKIGPNSRGGGWQWRQ